MRDPYTVLGVSPSATDEAVKKAYRELARKYHPDNYQNNPLADLAEEKMKEINEAYDTITKQRSVISAPAATAREAEGMGRAGKPPPTGPRAAPPTPPTPGYVISSTPGTWAGRSGCSSRCSSGTGSGTSSPAAWPAAGAGWMRPCRTSPGRSRWSPIIWSTARPWQ